jgi:nicotinamide-nucleotide amidase
MKEISTAEILCVGTELLLGDIINTNAAYLSRELAGLGISVYHQTVVGDNPERLKAAVSLALSRSDLVVMTGGLGPTCDDLTRETVAELFGRELVMRYDIADEIKSYFASSGRKMTDNNLRQAMVPQGAETLHNDRGTAPGLMIDDGEGHTVVMMPGVPSEMVNMFEKQVKPRLLGRRNDILVSRNLHLFGIGESAAEEILISMMDEGVNPTVAPYAKEGEVRLRITAKADSEEKALYLCDEMIEKIKTTEVGKFIYGIDVGSIENTLISELRKRGLTLSCAESCTGGLVSKRIVDLSGCSDVFVGGAVTYANSAKTDMIGVSSETLERYGAVSEQTAVEMAKGVRKALGADVGISTTGIAGPGGGTPEKPVGTVFVAVSTKDGEVVKRLTISSMRDRDYIRFVAASNALHLALITVKK